MQPDINVKVLGRAVIVLGALNNRDRIAIIEALEKQTSMNAREIRIRMKKISHSRLWNHLQILKEAGLIEKGEAKTTETGWLKHTYRLKRDEVVSLVRCVNLMAAISPGDLLKKDRRKAGP